jgi:hypothetical protein
LKQQLLRSLDHHTRDIEVVLQQQATLLAAAETASSSLDAAIAGSPAAQALFNICTRASSPSPAAAAAEFRRLPASFTSTALLGQLHASRRASWSSGGVASTASSSYADSKPQALLSHSFRCSDSVVSPHASFAGVAAFAGQNAAPLLTSIHAAAASDCADPVSLPGLDFVCSIGTKGCEDGQFDAPWGVAVDEEGCIIVSEKNANRLQVLQRNEENGQWFFSKKTELQAPRGVACFKGTIVVALTDSHELLLKPNTSLVSSKREWVHLGSGLLNNPNGVDIDSDFNIWIADTGNR